MPPKRQGVSEADVVWDMCGSRSEPTTAPSSASRGARARPGPASRRLTLEALAVVVEAGAALAAELAVGDQRAQQLRAARGPDARTRRGGSSPIATATSRPTKSSSASGPIGCPAPSVMQVSTAAGVEPGSLEQPHGVEQVREQQPVDDEARLVGDLDGASCRAPRTTPTRSAADVGVELRSGRQSSTSSIFVTGLKTWSPKRRSAMPRGRRGRRSRSDEVVVARSASGQRRASVGESARSSSAGPRRSPRRSGRSRRARRRRSSP